MPKAQAALIEDSLRLLPIVRLEAQAWRESSRKFQASADSARRADGLHKDALKQELTHSSLQLLQLESVEADAANWKHKAKRANLLNFLLEAAAAALVGIAITH